jgi:bifunctional oligoribonuclease and PAP phosphatase NrnA
MTTYTSSATSEQIAEFIKRQSSLVILTHAKPDGDALGSALTVARAAAHAGVPSECWFLGPFPSWTEHFASTTPIRKLSPDNVILPTSGPFADPSGVVVVDTGAWQQLRPLDAWLRPRADRAAIIDHHLQGDADAARLRLITPRAASCTEALAPVVDALLATQGQHIPLDVATAMYLGLATDTGWLRFSNTTAATLRLAARLIESGVDHPAIYQAVEQQQVITRPRLLGLALSSLETFHAGRVAVMSVRDADLRALGAVGEDTGGFAEPVMAVSQVQVVVSLTEMPIQADGLPLTKASLRSKPGPGAIDVAAIAHSLGGGGHARAAGIKLRQPLDAAKATIVAALA